jgi:hypothetical protein
MAEFAEILNIISCSMGYTDNQFLNAYKKSIEMQTEEALEANTVAATIIL